MAIMSPVTPVLLKKTVSIGLENIYSIILDVHVGRQSAQVKSGEVKTMDILDLEWMLSFQTCLRSTIHS